MGFCPDGLRSGMKWQNHPAKAPHFPEASLRGWELGERGGGLWMWVLLLWPRNWGTRQPENASLKHLCVPSYHLYGRVAFASRSQMRRPANCLQQPLRSSQSPVPSKGQFSLDLRKPRAHLPPNEEMFSGYNPDGLYIALYPSTFPIPSPSPSISSASPSIRSC